MFTVNTTKIYRNALAARCLIEALSMKMGALFSRKFQFYVLTTFGSNIKYRNVNNKT
jgi:hypothetical protein